MDDHKKIKLSDMWFKTGLDLQDLGKKLGLLNVSYDYENVFEWVSGEVDGYHINISRTHLEPPSEVETNISLEHATGEKVDLHPQLQNILLTKLKKIGVSPIYFGSSAIGENDKFTVVNLYQEIN